MANKRRATPQRGQALAEMGMVVLLFVVLTLGIIDFGRMLMILNVITHAARDGARAAAVVAPSAWGSAQTGIVSRVEQQIATVTATSFTINAGCQIVNGTPNVTLRVEGPESFLFSFPGLWGGDVQVDRTATFRYEPLSAACPS